MTYTLNFWRCENRRSHTTTWTWIILSFSLVDLWLYPAPLLSSLLFLNHFLFYFFGPCRVILPAGLHMVLKLSPPLGCGWYTHEVQTPKIWAVSWAIVLLCFGCTYSELLLWYQPICFELPLIYSIMPIGPPSLFSIFLLELQFLYRCLVLYDTYWKTLINTFVKEKYQWTSYAWALLFYSLIVVYLQCEIISSTAASDC